MQEKRQQTSVPIENLLWLEHMVRYLWLVGTQDSTFTKIPNINNNQSIIWILVKFFLTDYLDPLALKLDISIGDSIKDCSIMTEQQQILQNRFLFGFSSASLCKT